MPPRTVLRLTASSVRVPGPGRRQAATGLSLLLRFKSAASHAALYVGWPGRCSAAEARAQHLLTWSAPPDPDAAAEPDAAAGAAGPACGSGRVLILIGFSLDDPSLPFCLPPGIPLPPSRERGWEMGGLLYCHHRRLSLF